MDGVVSYDSLSAIPGLTPAVPGLTPQSGRPHPEIDRQAVGPDGMLVPHYRTFQSLYNLFSKTYSHRWDEAVRHGLEDARAMRNDTYFRALIQERLGPLGLWDWKIEPDADPLNPKAPHSEDRKLVGLMLEAEAKACPGLMKFRRHLGWCVWFGRVGNQVEYARNPDLPWSPLTVRRWEPVDGDKLQYSWDSGGHWCVLVNPTHRGDYPPEETGTNDRTTFLRLRRPDYRQRFVVGVHEIEDAPYEEYLAAGRAKGVGLRDFVFWGWWLRDEMLSWMVNLAEKAGTLGILIFKYPAGNKAAMDQATQNAKDVNNRNAIAVPVHPGTNPEDYGVEVVALPTEGLRFLKEVTFDYFDKHFERLFVGQTLSAGTEGSGLGGEGVAEMHADTKFALLKFDALNQAEYLTEDYVRVLQRLNHPDDRWVYRWKYQLPDPRAKDKLEAITKAASIPGKKLTYKADEVYDLIGMSRPDDGDDIVGGEDVQPGMGPPGGPGVPGLTPPGGGGPSGAGLPHPDPKPVAGLTHKVPGLTPPATAGLKPPDGPVTYEARHAPSGGIDIGGKHFTGGQFIPAEVVAQATAAERAKLDGKDTPHRPIGLLARLFGRRSTPTPTTNSPPPPSPPKVTKEPYVKELDTPAGKYRVNAKPWRHGGEDHWLLDFRLAGDGGETTKLTGSAGAKAVGVMRAVGESVDEFVTTRRPATFEFSADSNEPSRVRLYDRISGVIAERHGYTVLRKVASDGAIEYHFARKSDAPTGYAATVPYADFWDVYLEYEVRHAPAGGADIGGEHFIGGQFIPADVIDRATAGELAKLDGKGGGTDHADHPNLKPLAGKLDVKDHDNPTVKKHVADLARVPPALHDKLAAAGAKVYVGGAGVSGLDDMGHLRGQRPRGWDSGSWDDVSGGYDPNQKHVMCGTGKGSSASVALHEYGHAVGHLLGLDADPETRSWHEKLHAKLPPYLQQGGPGGKAGVQEMVAESFAGYWKHGEKGLAKVAGPEYAAWFAAKMRGLVDGDGPGAAAGRADSDPGAGGIGGRGDRGRDGLDRQGPPGLAAVGGGGGAAGEGSRPVAPRQKSKGVRSATGLVDTGRRRRVIKAVKNEGELADAIGGFNLPDSEPADVVYLEDAAGRKVKPDPQAVRDMLSRREMAVRVLKDKKSTAEQRAAAGRVLSTPAHFFEVKTLITSKAGKVRMSSAARKRKERWENRYGVAFHVVAFDDRRGQKHSGHRFYVWPNELSGTHDIATAKKAGTLREVLKHASE